MHTTLGPRPRQQGNGGDECRLSCQDLNAMVRCLIQPDGSQMSANQIRSIRIRNRPVQDNQLAQTSMRADGDEAPQKPTLLVFKDGHEIELANYAIVGVTLFDLTPGHARKIALADLDLEATQRQNDDRGVVFALPASTQAN